MLIHMLCEHILTTFQPKMVYASSRETLKNALSGHGMDWQANDDDEMEYTNIVKVASKGKAT